MNRRSRVGWTFDQWFDGRLWACRLRLSGNAGEQNERKGEGASHSSLLSWRSINLVQRNQVLRRRRTRRSGELDRRQILEHEIPFPSLRRIRRLEPVPCRDGARECERGQTRIALVPAHRRGEIGANGSTARVGDRRAQGESNIDEDLPVLLRVP